MTRATISGTTTRSGTLKSVKMPVARMEFQKGSWVVEPDRNRSR